MRRKLLVSVIGGHKCDKNTADLAYRIGGVIAEEGACLVCGGLGGVMEHVSKGAKDNGGVTIGILPGENKSDANPYIDIAITTGMGYSRNTIVAGTADIVVALPGEYGTLSEIGFAFTSKKPVYGFNTWDIKDIKHLKDPDELRSVLRKYNR